ncbi:hypothetical protein B566_EDAN007646 [Ephemera danica]|nr:hypothetical protein B566_EDAN007646 [Ephemera danica]
MLQIKIWFQNRRTKWKRKYTNDLELVAQQYYSALGVAAPRPLFLGDRLWFFNYPSMGGPPPPQHSYLHPGHMLPLPPHPPPHHPLSLGYMPQPALPPHEPAWARHHFPPPPNQPLPDMDFSPGESIP